MKAVKFREKSLISRNRPTQGPQFHKLQKAIWLIVIKEIFKFPTYLDHLWLGKLICMNSHQGTWITQFKIDIFELVSGLLETDFVNYRKPYG